MVITYCSSYTSLLVAFSTRFLLRKLVNFKWLPAICWMAISKCPSPSYHLVSLAMFCLLHRFFFQGFKRLVVAIFFKKNILSVKKNRNFANLQTTASSSNSPIEYFFSLSFRYLLLNAIGFISPSDCFCHKVILSPVLPALVVMMFSLSFA